MPGLFRSLSLSTSKSVSQPLPNCSSIKKGLQLPSCAREEHFPYYCRDLESSLSLEDKIMDILKVMPEERKQDLVFNFVMDNARSHASPMASSSSSSRVPLAQRNDRKIRPTDAIRPTRNEERNTSFANQNQSYLRRSDEHSQESSQVSLPETSSNTTKKFVCVFKISKLRQSLSSISRMFALPSHERLPSLDGASKSSL